MQEKDKSCMHDSFISDLQIGDWIKFKYQDEFFPGDIKKMDNNLITISAIETKSRSKSCMKMAKKVTYYGVQ